MFLASFFLFFYFLMGSFSLDIKGYSQLIERDVFFNKCRKINPKLSPNGDKVAFLSYDDGDFLNLFIYDIKEKTINRLTDNKCNINNFLWNENSNSIIYILDNNKLFEVNGEDKNNKFISSFNDKSVDILEISLGKCIIAVGKEKLKDLYSIDLEENNYEMNLVFENTSNIIDYFLDKDLKVKAFLTEDKKNEKSLFVKNKTKYMQIMAGEKNLSIISLYDDDNVVFKNNNDLFYTCFNDEPMMKKLCSINNFEPIIDPQSKCLIAIYDYKKRKNIVFNGNESLLKALSKYNNGMIKLIDKTKDNTFLVKYTGDDNSIKFYLYDEKNNDAFFLFSDNEKLEKFIVPNIKKFSILDKTDSSIEFSLALPMALPMVLPMDKNAKPPLIILFSNNDKDAYMRWLSNRGYAVVSFSNKNFLSNNNLILSNILEIKKYLLKTKVVDCATISIIADEGVDMNSIISMLTLAPMDFNCASINLKKTMQALSVENIQYLQRPILINYNNEDENVIENSYCSFANNKNYFEYLYNIENFLNLKGAKEKK